MNAFLSALWAEALKAWRSRIVLVTCVASLLVPMAGGLFMIILKNPEQARSMGIIGAKAQLTMGSADWPSYLGFLAMGIAGVGLVLFSMITIWVFGREFSDHTVKEWMALPTPRSTIVGAKYALIVVWCLILTLIMYLAAMGVGLAVVIPGWQPNLGGLALEAIMLSAFLNILLMPAVAFVASWGRGFLPPVGWVLLSFGLANLANVLGWGDWFPVTIPMLASGLMSPTPERLPAHSYFMVALVFIAGLAAMFSWWRSADQSK
jgi:ABC-2 type transport system permease protein